MIDVKGVEGGLFTNYNIKNHDILCGGVLI